MRQFEFRVEDPNDLCSRAERILNNAEKAKIPGRAFFDQVRFSQEIKELLNLSPFSICSEAAMWKAIFRSIPVDDTLGLEERIGAVLESLLLGKSFASTCMNRDQVSQMREESFEVRVIGGHSRYLKSPNNMDVPENYAAFRNGRSDPRYFNFHDFQAYKALLNESYGDCDPALERILSRALPEALLDPRTTMVLVRKNQELAAMGKIQRSHRHSPDYFDIGSMYSSPGFRWEFGLGEFVGRILKAHVSAPRDAYGPVTYGWASIHSPAIARHFKYAGVVGTGMRRIYDAHNTSEPVLALEQRDWIYERSAISNEAPSDDELLSRFAGGDHEVTIDDVRYHLVDTRKGGNDKFLKVLDRGFDQGRFLTRFSVPNRGDLSKTIVGFEFFPRHQLDTILV